MQQVIDTDTYKNLSQSNYKQTNFAQKCGKIRLLYIISFFEGYNFMASVLRYWYSIPVLILRDHEVIMQIKVKFFKINFWTSLRKNVESATPAKRLTR